MFKALTDLVVGYKNLKVRINAAVALASPTSRTHYGRFYLPVWISLLKALDNSQNVDDLNEFKHRDNLIEQVGTSILYLKMFNLILQKRFKPSGRPWVYYNKEKYRFSQLTVLGSNSTSGAFFDLLTAIIFSRL